MGLEWLCGEEITERQRQKDNKEGCGRAEVNGQVAAGAGSPGVT